MDAAFGQDVDPHAVELQLLLAQIELQVFGEFRHMLVQHLHQILKDREPPRQIGQRRVGRIADIAVRLAPVLASLIIIGDNKARVFHLGRVNGFAVLGQSGTVKAGDEE